MRFEICENPGQNNHKSFAFVHYIQIEMFDVIYLTVVATKPREYRSRKYWSW